MSRARKERLFAQAGEAEGTILPHRLIDRSMSRVTLSKVVENGHQRLKLTRVLGWALAINTGTSVIRHIGGRAVTDGGGKCRDDRSVQTNSTQTDGHL